MMKMGTGSLLGAQKQNLGAVVLSLVLLAMCALPLAAAAQHRHTTHRRMMMDMEHDTDHMDHHTTHMANHTATTHESSEEEDLDEAKDASHPWAPPHDEEEETLANYTMATVGDEDDDDVSDEDASDDDDTDEVDDDDVDDDDAVDDDDEVVEAQANETTDSSVMAWDEDSEVSQAEGSYIDVSRLFELNLTETPEYAAAYDTYTTPLDMDDMADELKELADECSANITGPAFCDSCVRPIARLEISNYYQHMMNDSIPENLTQPQQHAVFDRAGEQIMERLESYGVPMDGFFYANVIFCSMYDGDSACKMNATLQERVEPILNSCKSTQAHMAMHQQRYHDGPSLNLTTQSIDEHNSSSPHEAGAMLGPSVGSITPEADVAAEAADTMAYCLGCYWPFVDMMINHALSDAFWCEHRGVLNGTEEAPTTETALTDLLHTDVSFVACMENARAIFLNEAVDPFDADLTDEIRDYCWLEGYKPSTRILTAQTRARVDALECTA